MVDCERTGDKNTEAQITKVNAKTRYEVLCNLFVGCVILLPPNVVCSPGTNFGSRVLFILAKRA